MLHLEMPQATREIQSSNSLFFSNQDGAVKKTLGVLGFAFAGPKGNGDVRVAAAMTAAVLSCRWGAVVYYISD
jgi:hypothetical protein